MQENKRLLPAYPLFVKDPFFSVWSACENLNEQDTVFWTGKAKKTYGFIKVGDKNYCFMGNPDGIEKLQQTDVKITTFRTIYTFECADFIFEVAFFSPTPITNYKIWSCPVSYVEYKITPKTNLPKVTVSLCMHEGWCYYGTENKEMRGDVFTWENREIAWFGLNRQHIFNRTGDRFGADWGYYYMIADSCFYHTIESFKDLTACDFSDKIETTKYLTAQNSHEFSDLSAKSGKILIAFDDIISINYYGQTLRGYFFSDGKTIMDAIKFSVNEYQSICDTCDAVERDLENSTAKFGKKYLDILNASYRQTLAAHKLVKDYTGRLLLLSKECGSGGCVATVDVTYPTMPMLLTYAPELVKASIEPIFDFAKMDAWEYEFAPHDAGVYPFCNGQFYGVKNKTEGKYGRSISYQGVEFRNVVLPSYYLYPKNSNLYDYNRQMPIEECADMILICAFYLERTGDLEYVKSKRDLLKQWCEYLISKGLIPENQLCTDDFLQHMDKNVNLSIKATVAIKAFAMLEKRFGNDASKYEKEVSERIAQYKQHFGEKNMSLSFGDENETFSMKYNLLPDKLLKLGVFDSKVIQREIDVCMQNCHDFGFPLDNRSSLTKCDWMMWIAALSDDSAVQERIISCVYNYLINGADRVPFADLYDCKTGIAEEFTNRTVQGSMFILLLKELMQE